MYVSTSSLSITTNYQTVSWLNHALRHAKVIVHPLPMISLSAKLYENPFITFWVTKLSKQTNKGPNRWTIRPSHISPPSSTEVKSRTQTCLIPSQSARSRAFASAVDRPTTLTGRSVWDEMKLVLETITSSTGPRSLPDKHNIGRLTARDINPYHIRNTNPCNNTRTTWLYALWIKPSSYHYSCCCCTLLLFNLNRPNFFVGTVTNVRHGHTVPNELQWKMLQVGFCFLTNPLTELNVHVLTIWLTNHTFLR